MQNDPFRPTGPYAVAKLCEETIAQLEAERAALPRSERRPINKRIAMLRRHRDWCRTRAGYVEPDE